MQTKFGLGKHQKGFLDLGVLVVVAGFAIMLFILPLVVVNVRVAMNSALGTLNDAATNSSVANVQTQFLNSITLLAVGLIVAAAVVIISLLSFGGVGRGRR